MPVCTPGEGELGRYITTYVLRLLVMRLGTIVRRAREPTRLKVSDERRAHHRCCACLRYRGSYGHSYAISDDWFVYCG